MLCVALFLVIEIYYEVNSLIEFMSQKTLRTRVCFYFHIKCKNIIQLCISATEVQNKIHTILNISIGIGKYIYID